MIRAIIFAAAMSGLMPTAHAQEQPAADAFDESLADPVDSTDEEPATEDGAEKVIVEGKPSRQALYAFYQTLASNDFCPPGLEIPRGHSCAEITYDVLDRDGELLRKCNVPIFRVYRYRSEYMAVTYQKFDCSDEALQNRSVSIVNLAELFDPTTKDGTVFQKVGVMGIGQATDLCSVSSELCVVELFDRQRQLSYCSSEQLWALPVKGRRTPGACPPLR